MTLTVEWRVSILGKGLNGNAAKFKVMMGNSVGKMNVNCETGVQINSASIQNVKRGFTSVCDVDGFSCNRFDGIIQANLAEDLVLDGEIY